jgi:hypothetical protein
MALLGAHHILHVSRIRVNEIPMLKFTAFNEIPMFVFTGYTVRQMC